MAKNFWDKIHPNGVVNATPLNEIMMDLRGKEKTVIKLGCFYLFLSDIITGFILQLIFTALNDEPIILFNCIILGFQYFPITLILMFIFSYGTYKIYRSQKKTYKLDTKRGIMQSTNGTYGNQHFQTPEEQQRTLNLYSKIEDTKEDILGINENGQICALKRGPGINFNEIYFGDPGSGKSASIIKTKIYQTALRGASMVVTDSKGDLYKEVSATMRDLGYIVRVLNLKPEEFKNSDAFDIFTSLDAEDPALDSKVDVIAHGIIQNTSAGDKEVAEYWGKNEFNLIKFLILLLTTVPIYSQMGKKNFAEMFNMLSSSTPSSLASVARNIPKGTPCRTAYDIFSNCEEKNQGQIINGASIRLSQLSNPYLQEVLKHNEIDLVRPMKEKCIYFVVISDTTDAYGFLSSLFFQFMIDEQCKYSDNLDKEEKEKQLPVVFLLDEYKNVKGIPTMPTVISTVRSRKIALVMILQDLAQLEVLHGKENAATILNNCAVKGLLSTNDLYTAEYFEKLLGSMTIVVDNQRAIESAADVLHAHPVQQKTKGEGERNLMSAAELTSSEYFERDEIIYIIKGMFPLKLKKYFSEKAGEAIHPLEIRSRQLGERPCKLHKPIWRKELEEEKLRQEEKLEKMATEAPTDSATANANATVDTATDAADASSHISPAQASSSPVSSQEGFTLSFESKADTQAPSSTPKKGRGKYTESTSIYTEIASVETDPFI